MEEMEAEIYLCYIDNLCPDLVAQLHRAGYLVDGSVINSEGRLRQALAWGSTSSSRTTQRRCSPSAGSWRRRQNGKKAGPPQGARFSMETDTFSRNREITGIKARPLPFSFTK